MIITQNKESNYNHRWNINKNVAFKYKNWTIGAYIEAAFGITLGVIAMLGLMNAIINIFSSFIKYG
jgi:hypothetical protein